MNYQSFSSPFNSEGEGPLARRKRHHSGNCGEQRAGPEAPAKKAEAWFPRTPAVFV